MSREAAIPPPSCPQLASSLMPPQGLTQQHQGTGRLKITSSSPKTIHYYRISVPRSDALVTLLLAMGKELGVKHVRPRWQGGRMLRAGSSTGLRHATVAMKRSGGLRATQKGHWHLPKWSESCIINSHSVVPSSVSNLGPAWPHTDDSVVPLSLKCFLLCLIYTIARYHLCKALHSFSAHDKWPSVNETTGRTCYAAVTDDCSTLCFVWKMPLSHLK